MDAVKAKVSEQEIIRTKYWELPVESLDEWRPFTAYIKRELFEGPSMNTRDKGLDLSEDLMGGCHGARGSGKDETMTYLLGKKMVAGQPVWTNYPVSFYVIEPDGSLTYHESMPLDFDKFGSLSKEVSKGAAGVTELQYYVESRTSGRLQNRMFGYKIMQIRKDALSFLYNVQDQGWVDKRFGWSNDFEIDCSDVSKMNYDYGSIADLPDEAKTSIYLRRGAIVLWTLRDMSGILTGIPFKKSQIEYGPMQFDAWNFWGMYPTNFKVNPYDAYHALKTKDDAKQDKEEAITKILELACTELLSEGITQIQPTELCEKANEIGNMNIAVQQVGNIMRRCGVPRPQKSNGSRYYDLSVLLPGGEN